MNDSEKYEALEQRVNGIDDRLIKVETSLSDMRLECQRGFERIENHLNNMNAERMAWSAWVRDNVPAVVKWIGKWAIILTLAAIGVNNIPSIVKLFSSGVVK